MTKGVLAWLGLTMMAVAAAAQTTVTTSGGTTNTVPVYTGSSTVGNSPISVSGGNVGIGTTSPATVLDIGGGVNYTNYNPALQFYSNSAKILQIANSGQSVLNLVSGINIDGGTLGALAFSRSPAQGDAHINVAGIVGVQKGPITTYAGGQLQFWTKPNGDWANAPRMVIDQNGYVGIGTTSPGAKLEVGGSVKLTAGSGGAITFQDGTTQSTAYTGVTCGGDYAESVDIAGDRKNYEPGDVLVIGAESGSDVLKSAEPYSTLVAGIYSTKPGVVGRRQTTDPKISTTEVPMAMVGIVPTKVSAENGSIMRGDLLVTSSMVGYAMKGTERSKMLGAVLGKALGNLDSGTGVIEVLVTLQ